eukprot:1598459-Alexandrium_andersonii.AAC.1
MSASLVGSEMCIRDSPPPQEGRKAQGNLKNPCRSLLQLPCSAMGLPVACLLYTSDAAAICSV